MFTWAKQPMSSPKSETPQTSDTCIIPANVWNCIYFAMIAVAVFSPPQILWIPRSPHLSPRLSNKSTRRFWKRLAFSLGQWGWWPYSWRIQDTKADVRKDVLPDLDAYISTLGGITGLGNSRAPVTWKATCNRSWVKRKGIAIRNCLLRLILKFGLDMFRLI